MVDFKLTRHPSLNLPEQRLTAIEKQLGERTRESGSEKYKAQK